MNFFSNIPSCGMGRYTLCDAGEVIRRVGVNRGFDVVAEFRLTSGRRIDWVWLSHTDGALQACFEIEGADAPRRSIKADLKRFDEARDVEWPYQQKPRCYIVTYQRRYNLDDDDYTELADRTNQIREFIRTSGYVRYVRLLANPATLAASIQVIADKLYY